MNPTPESASPTTETSIARYPGPHAQKKIAKAVIIEAMVDLAVKEKNKVAAAVLERKKIIKPQFIDIISKIQIFCFDVVKLDHTWSHNNDKTGQARLFVDLELQIDIARFPDEHQAVVREWVDICQMDTSFVSDYYREELRKKFRRELTYSQNREGIDDPHIQALAATLLKRLEGKQITIDA